MKRYFYIGEELVGEIEVDHVDTFNSDGKITYLPEFDKHRALFQEFFTQQELIDSLEEKGSTEDIEDEHRKLDQIEDKLAGLGLFVKDEGGDTIEIEPMSIDLNSNRISYRG